MADQIRVGAEDPEAVRAEIEHTRARMSATIDEIEGVLVEKKARLQERFDVGARVREKPLHAAGIALGAGLLLGLLTGGGGRGEVKAAERRAAHWEERARRLLAIAQAQETEIESLHESAAAPAIGARVRPVRDERIDEIRERAAAIRATAARRLARAADRTRNRFGKRLRG